MKGKKGWLRIAEAFIAIALIASVLAVLYTRTIENPKQREEIYKLHGAILDEISLDQRLRQDVLDSKNESIENFVSTRTPAGFNFTVRICDIDDICGLQFYREEIFSSERIISSTLQDYHPKKVKIFMWQEK